MKNKWELINQVTSNNHFFLRKSQSMKLKKFKMNNSTKVEIRSILLSRKTIPMLTVLGSHKISLSQDVVFNEEQMGVDQSSDKQQSLFLEEEPEYEVEEI